MLKKVYLNDLIKQILAMNITDNFYCLGIEGTAHTLGIGIVDSEGRILANIRDSYIPPFGQGIHPRETARHHSEVIEELLAKVFETSKIKAKQLNLIAFSMGPGLGPCLRTTATAARALSSYLNIPLVGVNHIVAHVEIGKLISGARDPIVLIVSGGTTQVIVYSMQRYRIFGETLDIAIGNFFDKFAREVNLHDPENPWPGPIFDKMALKGKKFISLPYTVKGMDLTFSGMLTNAIDKYHEGEKIEDLCYSIQETALAMVTEVTERALAQTEKNELLLTGGFARNKRLQEMLRKMTKERDDDFYIVPKDLATDNGVMIAWTGFLSYNSGISTHIESSYVKQNWRIDEVPILWNR